MVETAPAMAPGSPLLEHPTARPVAQAAVQRMQRQIGNARSAQRLAQRAEAANLTSAPMPPTALIVDDATTDVEPGQMKKSLFLAQLRTSVERTVDQALAGTAWALMAGPEIERQFTTYDALDAPALERTIRRDVPEAARASSASDYVPLICERVRQAVVERVSGGDPAAPASESEQPSGGLLAAAGNALAGVAAAGASIVSGITDILFKRRDGGEQASTDPQAIQARLGSGQPLDSGVQSRFGRALGHDLSQVRLHTDAGAARLASDLDARAFALGQHVTFGAEEYRPGTLVGDALIAHELAHVVQQGAEGQQPAEPMTKGAGEHDALEEDADQSAVGAVVSLWGGAKGALGRLARSAMPTLRSGLRLQRCAGATRNLPQPATPMPAGSPPAQPTPAAPQVPRQDYVFIMGRDRPNAPRNRRFYTAATRFFAGNGTLVDDRRTLAGMFGYLRTLRNPVGNLYIVSHAAQDGTLSFGLDDNDQDRHITFAELQNALRQAPGQFDLPPGIVDERTTIHIKGCNIGRSRRMLDALDQAFGGRGVITAPTHRQHYSYRGNTASESFETYFIEEPGRVALSPADQLDRFSAKYAHLSQASWRRILGRRAARNVDIAVTLRYFDNSAPAEVQARKAEEQAKLARPEMYRWREVGGRGGRRTAYLERTEYTVDRTIADEQGQALHPGEDNRTYFGESTYAPPAP